MMAEAINPSSHKHRLSLTVLLRWKRARQVLKLAIRSSERRAVKDMEFRVKPREDHVLRW